MDSTTSIRELAGRVARHPMLAKIPFETVVDYVVDLLRILNVPAYFEEKAAVLDISDHRAALPCGCVSVVQVRPLDSEGRPIRGRAYRHGTDSFAFGQKDDGRRTIVDEADLWYKIQGEVIYTSNKEGKIEVSYRGIAVDGEGYPLIPDTAKFMRAAEAFIKKNWFTVLFDMGRLTQYQLNNAQQEYAFAVGACETEARMPDIDKYESLYNSFCTLVPRYRQHDFGFRHDGMAEHLLNH